MNFFSVCLIVALTLGLWFRPNEYDWTSFGFFLFDLFLPKSQYDLIIGVISARDNFELRQSIRNTWFQLIENESLKERVKVWFVIGSQACSVPPAFRTDLYSCEPWSLHVPDEEEIATCSINQTISGHNLVPFASFQFKVLYPIILTKLGILQTLKHLNGTVTLYNAFNREEIVSSSFYQKKGTVISGYEFRATEFFILPKGFEGIVTFDNILFEDHNGSTAWNDGGGVIQFTRIFQNGFAEDGEVFNKEYTSAVSFFFIIHDKDNLTGVLHNQAEYQVLWEEAIEEENDQILQEAEIHKDILLVKLVDTYRNLPLKLLLFYSSIMDLHKFKFAMKTDDDCFINVPAIYKELISLPVGNIWWSRFRSSWVVERFGKWKEFEYTSPVYPRFACGSGSILSHNLVQWLVKNKNDLNIYQGEDVSLGIWLAAINPRLVHDTRWQCDQTSICTGYNIAQLNVSSMSKWWDNYKNCSQLCPCEISFGNS